MNQYNAFVSREEEMMGLDRSNDLVVCPKPRRVGVLANNLTRPLRLHMRYTKKKKHLPFNSDSFVLRTKHLTANSVFVMDL